ncbi:hypothetical protein C4K04_4757 [Pseudomonas chlororaphis]|uniref:Ketosynthase family 3 (KS3) domain-containing protein n=1 Tax=Pseudomonas chlororaphis TaxID=587753 RepID=A0A3G7TVI2_9PSED|nr:hypothetical protein [Pseudomonas chlororaphis]AZE50412.1 hypothetical protein C4K04_4757 [Pseudomonas chlororaphis]
MSHLYIQNAAAIGPLGQNLDEIWERVLEGRTAYGRVELSGSREFFAAETFPGYASDPKTYAPLFYEAITRLVADLKIETPVDAIFFATAVGNLADAENDIYSGHELGLEKLDFAAVEDLFRKTPAWGEKTRFICVPTGCCAGLQALGLAQKTMPYLGLCRAIVMSLDFGLSPLALEAFRKINATAVFDDQVKASPSRPFCKERDGFLFSDGGGAVLVSVERSVEPMPRITGYGCVSSAYHMTDIAIDGSSIRESIEQALLMSGLKPSQIGHVNLHASGTVQNDQAEYQALTDLIGSELPPITAFKGNHGHALGGSNMLEIALTWKMMREEIVPPTPNKLLVDAFDSVQPRDLSGPLTNRTTLKTASGFSGIHASVIMEL